MNPAIATLAEGYADRPREDRLCAVLQGFDESGTYRARPFYLRDVDAFGRYVWERWNRQEASPVD